MENLPSPTIEPTPSITMGPSQEEYDSVRIQLQEKDSIINQLQSQINELNTQNSQINALVREKDSQVNRINDQLQSLQSSTEAYQQQVKQLTDENAQLQAHIPGLQQQVQELQQHNSMLQQQIGPLQAQITKLQEEVAYKEKRIEELKEPKAVMPSSLAQGITNQTTSYGTSPSMIPTTTSAPSTSVQPASSGRRICPNCGASGFAVKEVEDKTRIISYIPKPIYAKKLVCTKCGFEF
jgi:DNA repair exonuclease SbcCD ATPase subunit